MRINWGRAITAAVVTKLLAVLVLAAIVAAFGPQDSKEAMAYTQQMGARVGPIAGFLFCIFGGWWTAKTAAVPDRVANGATMGVISAVLDIVLTLAFGGTIALLLVFSSVGRIFAGALGGWLSARDG